MKNLILFLLAASASILRANGAITVAFDSADSNVGAGLYAFRLSGVPVSPTPTFNAEFDLLNFFTIGNTANPLQATSSPTGWSLNGPNDINSVRWYFQNTSGAVNGIFEITGTPNLHGDVTWRFADPGHANVVGTANISAFAPEPASFGLTGGVAMAIFAARSSLRQRTKRDAPQPIKPSAESQ